MSFFPTNASQVQAFAGALYGVQVGSVTMAQVNNDIQGNGGLANTLNGYYSATFGGVSTATVASTVATNLGLTGDALTAGTAYITAQLNGAAAGARGAVVSNIVNLFSSLASDATFGAAATAWNTKVATAIAYTGATNVAIGSVVSTTSAVFTLSTGVDVADDISASRGNLTSTFKFSTGNETVNASVNTLGNDDILLDASTADADVLNVTGGTGTFTASNIETINLTTATAATLQLDNVTGVKNVNVAGTNTVTVDGFNASTLQPTIGVNNITRVVTVLAAEMTGTATAASAETINLSVSGLRYGTTAATQSGIAIDHADAADTVTDVLETLNITSTGSAANDFALTVGDYLDLSTVNITGDQSVQIRAATGDVSGLTINGSANTGEVTLRVERNGATTTATNAANYTGVDNIIVTDSDAATDAAVVSALKSGSKVTFGTSFAGNSDLSFQGATFAAMSDSVSVVLDNVAATPAGVTVAALNIQNNKSLNLTSDGHAASTSTTGANVMDALTGDFTTITVTGDTSLKLDLNIDDVQTATSTTTARTVTVNAAGMTGTAFINLDEITNNSKVGYSITGTANGDRIDLNNTAGTVNGGAGNDTITGGNGNDVINGGEGNDIIYVSYGTDSLTGGAGNDTFDIDVSAVSVQRQVSAFENLANGNDGDADDTLVVTINGVPFSYTTATAGTTTATQYATAFVAQHAVALAAIGITVDNVVSSSATATLTFTGAADGTAFTIAARDFAASAGAGTALTVTTTAAAAALDVNSTIVDFSIGDVINLAGLSLTSDGGYYEGAVGAFTASTEHQVTVITDQSFASAVAAETAIAARYSGSDTDSQIFVYLDSTLGKAVMVLDSNIHVDAASTLNQLAVFDSITTLTGIASTFSADSFILA